MRVWYSPAGHVLGTLSSRLGVVVGSDAGGSAGVTGGMGAIACLCCPRMSWHSKNAAVTAPVMAVWASSVMCISSSPNVTLLLNFWHHVSTASLSLNMRANCDGCLTPMWKVQRHLVVVGDAGFVQDLFKGLGYWSMHRVTAK